MQKRDLYRFLAENVPKIVISGIVVPTLQFFVSKTREVRRAARAAKLRQELVEIERFIFQFQSQPNVPGAAGSLAAAQSQRADLFARLEALSVPKATGSRTASTLQSIFLLSTPSQVLGWVIRCYFFFALISLLWLVWLTAVNDEDTLELFLFAIPFAILWQRFGRAVDTAQGSIPSRAWWRRVLLLYMPSSFTAGLAHGLFFLVTASLAMNTYRATLGSAWDDYNSRLKLLGLSYLFVTALTVWFVAFYIDRAPTSDATSCDISRSPK